MSKIDFADAWEVASWEVASRMRKTSNLARAYLAAIRALRSVRDRVEADYEQSGTLRVIDKVLGKGKAR